MMNAEQLYSHVHVTHTLHHRIEGLRQRCNARLRDYASRHQSAQGPSLLAALASSAASAEEAARRPLALPTASTIPVTAPLLLRGLRAATPQALHNALGHAHAAACSRSKAVRALVARVPVLRGGLKSPTVYLGLPLFLAVGSGVREPNGQLRPNLVPSYGLLGLLPIGLEKVAAKQSGSKTAAACLLAAAVLTLPLEVGRLVILASDQITLVVSTLVIVAAFALHNGAQWVWRPHRPPQQYTPHVPVKGADRMA